MRHKKTHDDSDYDFEQDLGKRKRSGVLDDDDEYYTDDDVQPKKIRINTTSTESIETETLLEINDNLISCGFDHIFAFKNSQHLSQLQRECLDCWDRYQANLKLLYYMNNNISLLDFNYDKIRHIDNFKLMTVLL
jgi:hypothetical protein